ncbi:MAG: ketoacyl-ACP synthase III [Flavobacteriales bacterium]|jgi:3-oxoacyl-[acyl-carrier-protein] synthase-3|nr:ketoacyl-ACP synthase III [Flavobacteriales bacterium]MBT6013198.1 ketoacyl-ACP synthase III [Flavobacteriales bacterium]MBT7481924.1 ketoacyl-ACP synthase III [Flavobacteriales bacterium]
MSKITAVITGIQGYVPDYILTNKELETLVDTNDEWITSRTGVKERRILKGEGTASSDLGTKAIVGLLKKTNTSAEEIDLIICATATPDMLFPSTACIIADKVGAINAFAYDIMAACSGFLFSVATASKFIETGSYKKIIVVGADKMSSIVDYTDRSTCIIFGDGAGAILLEPSKEGLGIQDSILRSDGSGREFLHMKGGGSQKPSTHETVDNKDHYIFQDGQPVFKAAVKSMADVSEEIMERNKLTADDVAWLVPHQANKRIIDATARRMGVGDDKVMLNIQKYGNTTNGTIPLCLWEWENQLNKGDNIILAAFGGGFTWGSIYLKWAYDSNN